MVIRLTFLFSRWNKESKTDDSVIISSLAFSSEAKISSDSLCPTPTLVWNSRFGNQGANFNLRSD